MSAPNEAPQQEEQPILSIIQQIKDRQIDPRVIQKEVRQACVEVLYSEDYSLHTIAQILRRSEKTVARDLEVIRERHALSPDISLVKKVVGELVWKSRRDREFLVRLSNHADASVTDRIQARVAACEVEFKLIKVLQSLGYLPTEPQQLVGNIVHHLEAAEGRTYEELKAQLTEIEQVAQQTGSLTADLAGEIERVRQEIHREEITSQVKQLEQQQGARIEGESDG